MADALTKKVFISVDSEETQQENLKASRRKFGVIQSDATDKENLVGRQRTLLNQKLQLESTPIDRKKKTTLVHQHSQTLETGPSHSPSVTEQDLTSTEGPSEKYWESLAESRRRALEDSLCENEGLHNRVRSLEDELNVTNEMLEQARGLVEVLKEMLEENEAEQHEKKVTFAEHETDDVEEDDDAEDQYEDAEQESNDQTPPSSTEKSEPLDN